MCETHHSKQPSLSNVKKKKKKLKMLSYFYFSEWGKNWNWLVMCVLTATSWWRVDEKAERQATTAATLCIMIPYFDSRRLRVARRTIFFPLFVSRKASCQLNVSNAKAGNNIVFHLNAIRILLSVRSIPNWEKSKGSPSSLTYIIT